eukprot:TRINITY_DN4162_c1_g1_i2.p1 TRINITY_DN4162_c1_g1~~TRINITY_DN4162_c1_g1_i2.p1  ORF type:complete len:1195 (-),score=140.37 TRINITY_DN4162_c1_g1_i2:33-3617(-)
MEPDAYESVGPTPPQSDVDGMNDVDDQVVEIQRPSGRSRPITAWPIAFHREDPTTDSAEADFLWPLVRYERHGRLKSYALRPLVRITKTDDDVELRAMLSLLTYDSINMGGNRRQRRDITFAIRPFLLYLSLARTSKAGRSRKLKQLRFYALCRIIEFLWSDEERLFALRPYLFHISAQLKELSTAPTGDYSSELKLVRCISWQLFWGLFAYSCDPVPESFGLVTRKFRALPLLTFHKGVNRIVSIRDHVDPYSMSPFPGYGYTVVLPFYWNLRLSADTHRIHLWPLFGKQSFNFGTQVEYSVAYPFFKYTVTDNENVYGKSIEAPWPLYKKSHETFTNGNSLATHKLFPVFSYSSKLEKYNEDEVLTESGYCYLRYWHVINSTMDASVPSHGIEGVFPFLHTFWDTNHHTAFYPILLSGKSHLFADNQTTIVSLPLLSLYRSNPGSSTVLTPIFYKHKSAHLNEIGVPLLLLYSSHNAQSNAHIEFWLPVYYQQVQSDGTILKIMGMCYLSYNNPTTQESTTATLIPFTVNHRSPGSTTKIIAVAPVVYYSYTSAQLNIDVLFPFRVRLHNATSNNSLFLAGLIPFVWYFDLSSPRTLSTTTGVFPFYMKHRNIVSNVRTRLICFLYGTGQYGPWNATWQLLFPVYYNYVSPSSSVQYIYLIKLHIRFLSGGGVPGTYLKAVTPFYWDINIMPTSPTLELRSRLQAVLPIWFRLTSCKDIIDIVPILPFLSFYYRRYDLTNGNYERLISITPLVLHYLSTYVASSGTRVRALLPLFYHSSSESNTTTWISVLLFYRNEDATMGTHKILCPFVYHKTDYIAQDTRTLVFPFYYYSASPLHETTFYTPFIMHKFDFPQGKESSAVFPIYYYAKLPQYKLFASPAAVYYIDIVSQATVHAIPFLLIHSHVPAKQTTNTILPLFVRHASPEKHMIFSPLYMYIGIKNQPKTNNNDDNDDWYDIEANDREAEAQSQSRWDNEYRFVVPFYASVKRGNKWQAQLALPWYFHYESLQSATAKTSLTCAFPFYYSWSDAASDSSFTCYFPFFAKSTKHGVRENRYIMFPLYSKSYDDVGGKAWDVAWPLFRYESSPSHTSLRVLPFYWSRQDSRPSAASFSCIFPFYFSVTTLAADTIDIARRFTLLFPLMFSWTDSKGSKRTVGSLALLPAATPSDRRSAPFTVETTTVSDRLRSPNSRS